MKKLYEVNRKYYVMAENESEAEYAFDIDWTACTTEIYRAKSIDSEWFDAIPFNSDDDRTCGEILKSGTVKN
jgi:hypothetical protein